MFFCGIPRQINITLRVVILRIFLLSTKHK